MNNDLESFQNGVDTIVEGCTTYGSTPTNNTPSKIVESIKAIYENRYNTGYNAGYKTGVVSPTPKIVGKVLTKTIAPNQSFTIPYGTTFTTIPKVYIIWVCTTDGAYNIHNESQQQYCIASNITKTGFTFTLKEWSAYTFGYNIWWCAGGY